MTKLKPCPFCGGENITIYRDSDLDFSGESEEYREDEGYIAVCDVGRWGCGASIASQPTKSEAIEVWNARAERTCKAEHKDGWRGFYCSKCGALLENRYCGHCGAKVVE